MFAMRSFEDICDDILEGMKQTKEDMIKDGLWTDQTTFEEWAEYAGRHVRLTEQETKE
jgi:hypothetical protein